MVAALQAKIVSRRPDFTDVMAGLVGVRLAVYDELLEHGELGPTTLGALVRTNGGPEALLAAVSWLIQHRLAKADGGRWRAIPIARARQIFDEFGPAAPEPTLEPGRSGGPEREVRQVARFAPASDPAAARPDAEQPRVHASAFLNLGDY